MPAPAKGDRGEGPQAAERKAAVGGAKKQWTQRPLSVSRVMQTYRAIAVREMLLRDEESVPYMQRKHFRLQQTGFSTVGHDGAEVEERIKCESLYERMKDAWTNDEEDEPGA